MAKLNFQQPLLSDTWLLMKYADVYATIQKFASSIHQGTLYIHIFLSNKCNPGELKRLFWQKLSKQMNGNVCLHFFFYY